MKERRPINGWFVIIFVQDQLKVHINVVHKRKKPHKCWICDYRFTTEGNLNSHVDTIHEGFNNYGFDNYGFINYGI